MRKCFSVNIFVGKNQSEMFMFDRKFVHINEKLYCSLLPQEHSAVRLSELRTHLFNKELQSSKLIFMNPKHIFLKLVDEKCLIEIDLQKTETC